MHPTIMPVCLLQSVPWKPWLSNNSITSSSALEGRAREDLEVTACGVWDAVDAQ